MLNKKSFLIGAGTASHQVEGNNTKNDIWALENMKFGGYPEKSGEAANHYKVYRDDIKKMKDAGLNAYRFSLEWSRIEPVEGVFDQNEIEHYRDMIHACKDNGIEPIVTLFHFTSPKWLIERGGWESKEVIDYFERYVEFVSRAFIQEDLKYICTINEANIGVLIAKYIRDIISKNQKTQENGALQIGLDIDSMSKKEEGRIRENLEVFKVEEPAVFVSPRSQFGIEIVIETHKRAVQIIRSVLPKCKVGLSLSLRDIQYIDGGKKNSEEAWHEEFEQFLDAFKDDDFFGLQNYTRTIFDAYGELPPSDDKERTQMGYEFYPQGLENVIRKVSKVYNKEILITENGIATMDDSRRVEFIKQALEGVKRCLIDHIPVVGYLHWSLIDNYEWQSGYSMNFGLMHMDLEHTVKESMYYLGSWNNSI